MICFAKITVMVELEVPFLNRMELELPLPVFLHFLSLYSNVKFGMRMLLRLKVIKSTFFSPQSRARDCARAAELRCFSITPDC